MKNRKIWLIMISVFILVFNIFIPYISASTSISEEWYKTWGGGNNDRATALAIDSSDNIYVAGYSEYIETQATSWAFINLVKYDSSGLEQWNRTWNASQFDYCNGMVLDSSDNIYLGGGTIWNTGKLDFCLIKYDSSGVLLWNRTWGGDKDDFGLAITIDSLDNVYLAGYTRSFGAGDTDISLVKYNSLGVFQWERIWNGTQGEVCYGITIDSSDNIYLVGYTNSFGTGDTDFCLIKYDSSGALQWNKIWGGNEDDRGRKIIIDSLGNIYITGETGDFSEQHGEMYLARLDNSGVVQWNLTFGGTGNDISFGLAMDSSNSLYFIGHHYNLGMMLLKYDTSGTLQLNQTGGIDYIDFCYAMALDSSGNIFFAGQTNNFGSGGDDMILVRVSQDSDESSDDTSTTTIPGYDSLFMICLICTVSVFLIKKRRKSLK